MTPEAQRIAIATACGWDCDPSEAHGWKSRGQWAKHATITRGQLISRYGTPDYLNDLNAMHEAEKVLKITNNHDGCGSSTLDCYERKISPRATAAKRAEAFLRTLSLWTE